jgi:hypothetical protein
MNFGKIRSLKTMGVAGALSESCEVLYSSVFNTRHLGQIADLLVARLRGMGSDELRFRMVITLAVFEAYKGQTTEKTDTSFNLSDPLHLECGFDEEKIALAITYAFPDGANVDFANLPQKIQSGSMQGYFEVLLGELHKHAHRLVIKYFKVEKKVEILCMFALDGKIDPALVRESAPLEVIGADDAEETPKTSSYMELGDLDYVGLLKDATPADIPEDEDVRTFAQSAVEMEERILVKGKKDPNQAKIIVSGATDKRDDAKIVVKSGTADERDLTKITIKSDANESDDGDTPNVLIKSGSAANLVDRTVLKISSGSQKDIEAYKDRIYELELKLKEMERQGAKHPASEGTSGSGLMGGLFKKVFSRGQEVEKEVEEEDGEDETNSGDEGELESAENITTSPVSSTSVPEPAEPSAVEAEAASLMVEIQQGALSHTLNKAQEESVEIQQELKSGKAKRWVDGLMTDLVQERAKLQDMARKVNLSIRKKEHEFRSKEMVLQDEIRRRDEMIRQKTNTLNRTKEQLAQMTQSMERMKLTSHSTQEDGQARQKLDLTKKVLDKTKEDNTRLTDKVEELKNQVAILQMKQAKKLPEKGELTVLQSTIERQQKQMEEFKKANAQLVEKVEKAKKEKYTEKDTSTEELKKRLEGAMKLVTTSKKENERLLLKVEELQREEIRLKMELNRANAQTRAKKGSSSDENPSSAA